MDIENRKHITKFPTIEAEAARLSSEVCKLLESYCDVVTVGKAIVGGAADDHGRPLSGAWPLMHERRGVVQIGGPALAGLVGIKILGAYPIPEDVVPLLAKYPEHWSKFKIHDIRARGTLQNMSRCNSPGARELLRTVDRRGFLIASTSSACGGVINYGLERYVYPPSPYGECALTFDTIGVMLISSYPIMLRAKYAVPIKIAAIVIGHAVARTGDRLALVADSSNDLRDTSFLNKHVQKPVSIATHLTERDFLFPVLSNPTGIKRGM